MDRRRLWARIRRVWITLGLSATVIFVVWSLIAYRASGEARLATRSDGAVTVQRDGGVWRFTPAAGATSGPSFVFFPGSIVEPTAYAPLARATAAAGFATYIVELPKRGAFGGAESEELRSRVRALRAETEGRGGWVVGGHSRGAVVASQLASEHADWLAGLVLIGTSHPRDVDLSALAVPVTKIVGTRDGLASPAEVEQNRGRLPAATRWVWVEGGNHSQFGWYGFQPGDRFAAIPAPAQRARMIEGVLSALRSASPMPGPGS
jgi:pimeloyl-ACP methyl ester carboxylesterase